MSVTLADREQGLEESIPEREWNDDHHIVWQIKVPREQELEESIAGRDGNDSHLVECCFTSTETVGSLGTGG